MIHNSCFRFYFDYTSFSGMPCHRFDICFLSFLTGFERGWRLSQSVCPLFVGPPKDVISEQLVQLPFVQRRRLRSQKRTTIETRVCHDRITSRRGNVNNKVAKHIKQTNQSASVANHDRKNYKHNEIDTAIPRLDCGGVQDAK